MSGAPVAVGDLVDVYHDCPVGAGPMGAQHHTALLPVTGIALLFDGSWWANVTRCGGSTLTLFLGADGRTAAGDALGVHPAVTS